MSAQHTFTTRIRTAVLAVAATATVALFIVASENSPAAGARGDALVLGQTNTSSTTTYLNWRRGQYPMPESGLAVVGAQTGAVFATNEEYSVVGDPTWIDGIRAFGNDRGAFLYGVDVGAVTSSEYLGLSANGGDLGVAATGDTGVRAEGNWIGLEASGEVAIQAEGAVSFSSAGMVTVPAGATSAATSPGTDVFGSSMVLATAQTPGGEILRVSKNPDADTVRVHLVSPATQPVRIAYFVIG